MQSSKWRTKRKLAIRLADDVTHCWVCGFSSRSLFPLLKKFGTQDQLAYYRDKFAPVRWTETEAKKETLKLPDGYQLLAMEQDTVDPDVQAVLAYLRDKRNITERDLWYYKFGYSSSLPKRAIMPSFDAFGVPNYFTARAIDDRVWPKYIDPGKEIISKTEIIFNEINIDWKQELLIVEGPFDLAKCPPNTVPLLGNQMSEDTAIFNKIIAHDTPCVVMLDDDANYRASCVCRNLAKYDIRVRKADLGGKKDPGVMSRQEVIDRRGQAKQWEWDDHIREKMNTIRLAL